MIPEVYLVRAAEEISDPLMAKIRLFWILGRYGYKPAGISYYIFLIVKIRPNMAPFSDLVIW